MRVANLLAGAVASLAILAEAAVLRTANTTVVQVDGDGEDPAAALLNETPWQTAKTSYKTTTEWWRLDPETDYGCSLTAQWFDNTDEKWQARYHVKVSANPGRLADALYPDDFNITERNKAVQKDMLDTWVEAFFVSNEKQIFHPQKRPEARVNYNYKAKNYDAEAKESQYWGKMGHSHYVRNQLIGWTKEKIDGVGADKGTLPGGVSVELGVSMFFGTFAEADKGYQSSRRSDVTLTNSR
ncbi:hypothetical protein V8F06_010464 [Rhypophila decipiens]